MKRGHRILNRIVEEADLPGEILPGLPVVEIAGERRVLVENHMGVMEYSQGRIGIKVKYGMVVICGSCMTLTRMTKEQLVVSGKIDGVSLIRRG